MKKVLLAVIGATPNQKTYRYAQQISKQIHAELDVLQVEKSRGGKTDDEVSMNPQKPGEVCFRRTTCTGDPNAVIVNYIHQNRDVVFTIYDASSGVSWKKKKIPKEIKKLPIPLVVVRG